MDERPILAIVAAVLAALGFNSDKLELLKMPSYTCNENTTHEAESIAAGFLVNPMLPRVFIKTRSLADHQTMLAASFHRSEADKADALAHWIAANPEGIEYQVHSLICPDDWMVGATMFGAFPTLEKAQACASVVAAELD